VPDLDKPIRTERTETIKKVTTSELTLLRFGDAACEQVGLVHGAHLSYKINNSGGGLAHANTALQPRSRNFYATMKGRL
jgi:hypothetical protein